MQMQTLPHTSIEVFIDSLATCLEDMMVHPDGAASSLKPVPHFSRFFTSRMPPLTIKQYAERVALYAPCSVECFVIALVYIRRISLYHGLAFINRRTIHRLFITSVVLAAKFLDDTFYNNKFYARVGGLSVKELNELELEFLFRLKFDCNVDDEEFREFSHILYEPERGLGSCAWVKETPVSTDGSQLDFFSISPATHSFLFPTNKYTSLLMQHKAQAARPPAAAAVEGAR
jgi:hypothetical protein